tara:strand:+ start:1684 stop:2658 length:975 start_codon:yes stop_codon:yes gene_type:complete
MKKGIHSVSSIDRTSEWGRHQIWIWRGFKIHWRVLGENNKRPVLFIHGFGASSSHWRFNAKDFSDYGFSVYAIDLIGFGQSDQPIIGEINSLDNKTWSDQVAHFIEEIINPNNNFKPYLIGNSLGGLVSLTTGYFNPNLIKGIIASPLPDPELINILPKKEIKLLILVKNFFIHIFFRILPLEILLPLISKSCIIKQALQGAYRKDISSDIDLLKIVRRPAQRKRAAKCLRLMCISMSTRNQTITAPHILSTLEKKFNLLPFLLIWGKYDCFVPLSLGEKIIKIFKWIDLKIINDAGHCSHDESPDQFNQTAIHWIEKINNLKD